MSRGRPRTGKNRVIKIRCSRETLISWRQWAAYFENYEEALAYLLRKAVELRLEPPKPL